MAIVNLIRSQEENGGRQMTVAVDSLRQPTDLQRMTLKEFLIYNDGTDARYELWNGTLIEMGAESRINIQIAIF